jgi:hypothetical protein
VAVPDHKARQFRHCGAVVETDGGLVDPLGIGPGDQCRHDALLQEGVEIGAAVIADQQECIGASGDERAYLFLLQVRLVGRGGDEQRLAVTAQFLLERLYAARENGVFHGGDDRAHGVGLLGGQRAGPEIRRVAKLRHRLHHPFAGFPHDLVGRIQATRHRRRRHVRVPGYVRQRGDRTLCRRNGHGRHRSFPCFFRFRPPPYAVVPRRGCASRHPCAGAPRCKRLHASM